MFKRVDSARLPWYVRLGVTGLAALSLPLAGCQGGSTETPTDKPTQNETSPGDGFEAPYCEPAAPTSAAAIERALTLPGSRWAGADLTGSIDLGAGRNLWLFGDTFIGTINPDDSRGDDTRMVANSATLQDGACFTSLLRGTQQEPIAWLSSPHAGEIYWPGTGVVVGEEVKLFTIRVERGNGTWTELGTDLVTLRRSDLALLKTERVPSDGAHRYGVAAAVHGDYLYAWGTGAQDPASFGKSLYVSRTPVSAVGSQWQVWDGTNWATPDTGPQALLPDVLGSQLSIHQHNGSFILVSKKLEWGAEIVAWKAPAPEGPWTELGLLATTPAPELGSAWITYMATAHPQVALPNGDWLVAYNTNTFDAAEHFRHASQYRPRFLEVTLPTP